MQDRSVAHYLFLALVLTFGISGTACGQTPWKRLLHQSFDLPDSVCLVDIDLPWNYEVERWPTNAFMVETTLEVANASETVLNGVLKQNRYAYKLYCQGGTCALMPVLRSFLPMQTTQGVMQETLKARIFLPDDFERAGDHLWTRMLKL